MGTYLLKGRKYEKRVKLAILNIIVTVVSVLVIVLTMEIQVAEAIESTDSVLLKLSQEVIVWLHDSLETTDGIGGHTTGQVEYQSEQFV